MNAIPSELEEPTFRLFCEDHQRVPLDTLIETLNATTKRLQSHTQILAAIALAFEAGRKLGVTCAFSTIDAQQLRRPRNMAHTPRIAARIAAPQSPRTA